MDIKIFIDHDHFQRNIHKSAGANLSKRSKKCELEAFCNFVKKDESVI